MGGPEELWVLPPVDREPQATTLENAASLNPAGFLDGSEYLVKMPGATWPAPPEASLAGWCSGDWEDGQCVNPYGTLGRNGAGDGPYEAGEEVTLDEGSTGTVFSAGWEVSPEAPQLVPAEQCGLKPTVTIPGGNDLYSYDPAEFDPQTAGDQLTVTATRNEPFVVWAAGAETEWTFPLSVTPCPTTTVSFDLNGGSGTFPAITGGGGDEVTLPTTIPTKDGYTFAGWKLGDEVFEAGATFTIPSEDATLSAQWKKVPIEPEKPAPGGGA